MKKKKKKKKKNMIGVFFFPNGQSKWKECIKNFFIFSVFEHNLFCIFIFIFMLWISISLSFHFSFPLFVCFYNNFNWFSFRLRPSFLKKINKQSIGGGYNQKSNQFFENEKKNSKTNKHWNENLKWIPIDFEIFCVNPKKWKDVLNIFLIFSSFKHNVISNFFSL